MRKSWSKTADAEFVKLLDWSTEAQLGWHFRDHSIGISGRKGRPHRVRLRVKCLEICIRRGRFRIRD